MEDMFQIFDESYLSNLDEVVFCVSFVNKRIVFFLLYIYIKHTMELVSLNPNVPDTL